MKLQQLQAEQKDWSAKNFPDNEGKSYRMLLGVVEEVGELMHAHLKKEQGIRVNEDHDAKIADAIGDVVIYLAGYCNQEGFDLAACVTAAWEEVLRRNWQKNKIDGVGANA